MGEGFSGLRAKSGTIEMERNNGRAFEPLLTDTSITSTMSFYCGQFPW